MKLVNKRPTSGEYTQIQETDYGLNPYQMRVHNGLLYVADPSNDVWSVISPEQIATIDREGGLAFVVRD